jgi:GMP reductase
MKYLKYSNISLVPNYSEVYSRLDCSTETVLCGKKFNLPIIPANMKSVINMPLAKWMSDNNYFYIMHRFNNSLREVVTQMNDENWGTISVSMGIKMEDKKDIVAISKQKKRVDCVTVDIAHGHCERMRIAIKCVKKYLPNTTIIAGNVATPEAVKTLSDWGADIVKVGIGQGSPCTTKDKTGFTMPMFTCVKQCSQVFGGSFGDESPPVPIIADGGVSCNGDIAKAMVAGATFVMAGGIFASCTDSPAVSSVINGVNHKAYFGSASEENKGHSNNVEGKLTNIVSSDMNYEEKLHEMKQDLQSAISYAGGEDLNALKEVRYIEV